MNVYVSAPNDVIERSKAERRPHINFPYGATVEQIVGGAFALGGGLSSVSAEIYSGSSSARKLYRRLRLRNWLVPQSKRFAIVLLHNEQVEHATQVEPATQ